MGVGGSRRFWSKEGTSSPQSQRRTQSGRAERASVKRNSAKSARTQTTDGNMQNDEHRRTNSGPTSPCARHHIHVMRTICAPPFTGREPPSTGPASESKQASHHERSVIVLQCACMTKLDAAPLPREKGLICSCWHSPVGHDARIVRMRVPDAFH